MSYMLDSDSVNFLIRENQRLQRYFRQALADNERFVLSPIVHFEVTRYLDLKGAAKLRRRYDAITRDWEKAELVGYDWDSAAKLWAELHRKGQSVSAMDLLIAITVIKTGAKLVTNNVNHFNHIGVQLENWMK
jgi:predicted nucleic acid-binding protein